MRVLLVSFARGRTHRRSSDAEIRTVWSASDASAGTPRVVPPGVTAWAPSCPSPLQDGSNARSPSRVRTPAATAATRPTTDGHRRRGPDGGASTAVDEDVAHGPSASTIRADVPPVTPTTPPSPA